MLGNGDDIILWIAKRLNKVETVSTVALANHATIRMEIEMISMGNLSGKCKQCSSI